MYEVGRIQKRTKSEQISVYFVKMKGNGNNVIINLCARWL